MKSHKELEYCNVAVWFDRPTVHQLMQALVEAGLDVSWKESKKALSLNSPYLQCIHV